MFLHTFEEAFSHPKEVNFLDFSELYKMLR